MLVGINWSEAIDKLTQHDGVACRHGEKAVNPSNAAPFPYRFGNGRPGALHYVYRLPWRQKIHGAFFWTSDLYISPELW